MSELKANNHYVPKLYLKQWQDSSNKVCVYKTLVSHENEKTWKKRSTGAIAYQRHLYTQLISGNESDDFERWLDREYESPASNVIHKAVNDKRLSRADWNILIRFLACQDVRTPARLLEHLNRGRSQNKKILQQTVEQVIDELEKGVVPVSKATNKKNEFDDLYPLKVITERDPNDSEQGLLKVESFIGRATWIHSIKHLLTTVEKILHTHKWSIVKPARGFFWPTSDNPVVKINYIDDQNYDFGGGWGRKNGNIFFPIGPEHAMFVQIGDKPILKGTRLDERLTKQVIKFIVEHAHRVVYCSHFDENVISIRPRVIDPEVVQKEKKQFERWHEENSKLEKEFINK